MPTLAIGPATAMYEHYFNLREKPFKLLPDPDYLFLSPSHAQALSSLSYAMSQGDGFVLITGEVGTGKTTLCRCFLADLADDYESAYIFNTQMDAAPLLLAICLEFGVAVSGTESIQGLLQALNEFLMAQHRQNRKAVLLIDEAQNLTIDNLEMVRLLSNLETSRHKLLHIILVGQPELADKLESFGLRQLAQRISIRCRLMLLDQRQTRDFIDHRIQVAAKGPQRLFTPGACRAIFGYARGTPRRINIAADRALVLACESRQPNVNAATARKAIRQLRSAGRAPGHKTIWLVATPAVLALLLIASIFFAVDYGHWMRAFLPSRTVHPVQDPTMAVSASIAASKIVLPPEDNPEVSPGPVDAPAQPAAMLPPMAQAQQLPPQEQAHPQSQPQPLPMPLPQPVSPPQPQAKQMLPPPTESAGPLSLSEKINTLEAPNSRWQALTHLLALWQQPIPYAEQLAASMTDELYFQVAALQYGLRLLIVKDDWTLVKRLNLPAIVALGPTHGGEPVFAAIVQWQDAGLAVSSLTNETIDPILLQSMAVGPAYIFWYNGLGSDDIISQKTHGNEVVQIKKLLRRIGYDHLSVGPVFDPPTYHAIVDFQMSRGINPDGLVGPITKIMLMDAAKAVFTPQLKDPAKGARS